MLKKKRLIFLLVHLGLATITFGQFDFEDYIQIGASSGYSLSTVDFQPSIRQSNNGGINGGLIINYFAEKNVGIQLEVNYAQRGWQDFSDSLNTTYKRTMNFIEIPLLAHISWHIGDFRLQLDLGPYIAFHNSYSEDYDRSIITPAPYPPDSIVLGERTYYGQPIDNELDYGFIVGAGPAYSSKIGEFQLRFRYIQGMRSVFKKYPEGNFRFSQLSSIYAGVAWVYPIYFNKKE